MKYSKAQHLWNIAGVRLDVRISPHLVDPGYSLYSDPDPGPADFTLTVEEKPELADRSFRLMEDLSPVVGRADGVVSIESEIYSGRLDLVAGTGVFLQVPGARDYRVALQLLLANLLEARDTLMIHGAGLAATDDSGYLFIGPSGAGKSTVANLWNAAICSDEACCLQAEVNRSPMLWGTPFGHSTKSTGLRLKAMFWLEQAPVCKVEAMPQATVIPLLAGQIIAGDTGITAARLGVLDRVLAHAPLRRLRFTREVDLARMLRESGDAG